MILFASPIIIQTVRSVSGAGKLGLEDMTSSPTQATPPATNPPVAGSEGLDRAALLDFLTAEIENRRSEQQAPGWTKWALYAGLASLVWLVFGQIEQRGATMQGTAGTFLLLNLLLAPLQVLVGLLEPRGDSPRPVERRFTYWPRQVGLPASVLAFGTGACALRIVLIFSVPNLGLQSYHKAALGIVYGVFLLVSLVALVFCFLRMPVPLRAESSSRVVIVAVITAGVFLWCGVHSTLHLLSAQSPPSLTDWRLGTLFCAAALVVENILSIHHADPSLEALIGTRRSLALGHTGPASAIRQADILLTGMRLDDILSSKVAAVISVFAGAEEDAKRALDHLGVCAHLIEDRREPKVAIEALLTSSREALGRCDASLKTFEDAMRKFGRAMRLARVKDADSDPHAKALQQKVHDALESAVVRFETAVGLHKEISSRLSGYSPVKASAT